MSRNINRWVRALHDQLDVLEVPQDIEEAVGHTVTTPWDSALTSSGARVFPSTNVLSCPTAHWRGRGLGVGSPPERKST